MVYRETCTLTVEEWRRQESLVQMAQAQLIKPELKQMIDALKNSNPAYNVYAENVPELVRIVAQARAEGYGMALANFEGLGRLNQPQEPIGPGTFEPEDKPDDL